MIKVAVLVSGGGTNLQAIIDAEKAGIITSGKISLVVASRSDAYALTRAENAGIPSAVLRRKDYADPKEYDAALLKVLKDNEIDLVVMAGFLSIVGEELIEAYRDRILNIHPSLLPSFGGQGFYGLKVHEAALERGVKVTGATVHFVNEIPDGGKILFQKAVEIREDDTPETLQRRVMEEAEWILLPAAVEKVSKDLANAR
ncbi:MAG: phosphoribosylglycinamide formyltransferase [Clostridiales bacterium]|nr:phosphoribosylglycinamide formyltransferase [Clostridiales bacterium]